jgi:hypothetical protein
MSRKTSTTLTGTKLTTCSHKSLHSLKNPIGLSFCKICGSGFYKNTTILKFEPIPTGFPNCLPELGFSPASTSSEFPGFIGGTPARESKFRSKLIQENHDRAEALELNPECRYLGALIADKFFKGANQKPAVSYNKCSLYSAGCLFLSAKLREVDLKTPYCCEMKKFGGNHWDKKEIKEAEIMVAQYFDWQLDQMTFFDY